MIKPISILMLLGFAVQCSYADSWAIPKTTRIKSSCSRYTAIVIPDDPTNAEKTAKVHVYAGDPVETGRWQTEWAVTLNNPTAPADVMLSDGGRIWSPLITGAVLVMARIRWQSTRMRERRVKTLATFPLNNCYRKANCKTCGGRSHQGGANIATIFGCHPRWEPIPVHVRSVSGAAGLESEQRRVN